MTDLDLESQASIDYNKNNNYYVWKVSEIY